MSKRMIAFAFVSLGAALGAAGGPAEPVAAAISSSAQTKVLVVGTIHQRHETNPNYSYADVVRILATFDPDLVCVEIRPQDFRKVAYLKEMTLATIWGLARGKEVVPIDWWDDAENVREVRDKLAQQPEYVEKEKQEKALLAASSIIIHFEKAYGPQEKESQWSARLGYQFWNGPDYNAFYAEVYRISMRVYGDSPINLYYQTRNGRMMELIRNALHDHPGRRTIVLTGSEHKHFFDRELRRDASVARVDFAGLLPLREASLDPPVAKFLDEDDDAPYYAPGYPLDPEAAFRNKLTSLVHGPDMDVFPDSVPAANIERAGKILERWRSSRPESDGLNHESAWLNFLRGDYPRAVGEYLELAAKIDGGRVADPWLRFDTYLNLGRCYDLLGERKKALDCYARSEELMAGTPWERVKDYIFQDARRIPYRRAKSGRG
jgi:tetratricopeptide (TPR) repeat protein